MTDLGEKILGCLLGGAVGDAMGGPYEGKPSGAVAANRAAWRLSDDTQLTLATCEAIVRSGGAVEPGAVAEQLAAWHARGLVTGVGASTYKALSELAAGGHWALVGRKGERAAGNGAAMRIAPLAFCLDPEDEADRRTIRDVCRITHHNEEAYAGALAIVYAVRAAAFGGWDGGAGLLAHVAGRVPDSRVRERLFELSELDPSTPTRAVAERFGASGYVAESVPLALFGAQRVAKVGFGDALREVVSAGGDADTNASMAGQVMGALVGYGGVPVWALSRLPNHAECERIARQFAETVTTPRGVSK